MARPSKFTAERRDRFLAALRTGVFPETAARHAGWSPATLYRILGAATPEHVAFRDDVRRVETELELRLAGTVTQAAFSDPRLALSLLERRFGERWGRQANIVGLSSRSLDGAPAEQGTVLQPALIAEIVPVLLAARLGPAGGAAALARVDRFVVKGPADDEE